MSTNTGGQAFPSTFHNGWGEPEKGMTLRDYFAAKAMQGALASHNFEESFEDTAKLCYQQADAMLEAREA